MLKRLLRRIAAWLILVTATDDDYTHQISIEEDEEGEGSHIHVTPINDLIEHEENDEGDCPCGPEVQPVKREDGSIGWVYIHNALDGRDLEEQGHGIPLENPHGLLDEYDGLD